MLIDWFTVGAQALNFLILVWLMKRYLYKPILKAIDARESKISAEIKAADAKKSEADKAGALFKKKNEDFDRERATLLSKAVEEANAERSRLLDAAGKTADELREKWRMALVSEQKTLDDTITQRVESEIFSIARKTLTDLAGTPLEERMTEVFIRRLHELGDTEKSTFTKSLATAASSPTLRSSFELPETQRAALKAAIKDVFAVEPVLNFEIASNLISGIELISNGQKLAWSIGGYLTSLETVMRETLMTTDAP